MVGLLLVSIHAPARGATLGLQRLPIDFQVSIHAPARGATESTRNRQIGLVFQSTRPRGARRVNPISDSCVSPCFNPRAREGRDRFRNGTISRLKSFNPRAREGRDLSGFVMGRFPASKFQSTRPRGARPFSHYEAGITLTRFNPRAREGRDRTLARMSKTQLCGRVSIHAPARGATHMDDALADYCKRFNPRAREGRDHNIVLSVTVSSVSIHAPARGATNPSPPITRNAQVSIHAPARGATSRLFGN